jgi:hypothetical protein
MLYDKDKKLSYQHSIQKVLVRALKNKSSKVTWNSCVAIAKIVARHSDVPDVGEELLFFTPETTKVLFDIISTRQNIKSRIQASLTLLNYKSVA